MGNKINHDKYKTFNIFFQSVVEIVGLSVCAAATGVSFFNINKLAGMIFVPYLAWLAFASYLNYSIYRLNTPAEGKIEDVTPEKKEK